MKKMLGNGRIIEEMKAGFRKLEHVFVNLSLEIVSLYRIPVREE